MSNFKTLRGILLAFVLVFAPGITFAEAPLQNESRSTASSAEVSQEVASGVNINTASAEELADILVGVGAKRAEAIVKYRMENGPFTDKAELMEVKGIGDSIFNKNQANIVL